MGVLLEFLKNNLALLTALGIVVSIIATIVGIAIHIRGDKKTKIEKKQKMNEFRNITFEFLIKVFSGCAVSNDNFPIMRGSSVDGLIIGYKQELAKHEPFMGYFEKRKYRNYISLAHNYNQHWLCLTSVKKSNEVVYRVLRDQKELIKHIDWLGEKTGREQEANKLKKDYE
jgi:hypothetical protein